MNQALVGVGRAIWKCYLNPLFMFTLGAICEGVIVALLLLPHLKGH